jgi:hypothetical protein
MTIGLFSNKTSGFFRQFHGENGCHKNMQILSNIPVSNFAQCEVITCMSMQRNIYMV